MEYIVHRLELHKTIGGQTPDGTIALFEYESLVEINNLEPAPGDHLSGGTRLDNIPAGLYLFTQGMIHDAGDMIQADTGLPDTAIERSFRDASEAVWLESLWLEVDLKNKRILVRILSEDNNVVFQIFREITGEASLP